MKESLTVHNIFLATVIELNERTMDAVKAAVRRIDSTLEEYPNSTALSEFRAALVERYRDLRAEKDNWETTRRGVLKELKELRRKN